jgi:hypothetical protein
VIVKNRISSTVKHAHIMFLVQDKETLLNKVLSNPENSYLLEDAIVVQRYIHNTYESLIKLYTIGDHFDILVKPSFKKSDIEREWAKNGFVKIDDSRSLAGAFKPNKENTDRVKAELENKID